MKLSTPSRFTTDWNAPLNNYPTWKPSQKELIKNTILGVVTGAPLSVGLIFIGALPKSHYTFSVIGTSIVVSALHNIFLKIFQRVE